MCVNFSDIIFKNAHSKSWHRHAQSTVQNQNLESIGMAPLLRMPSDSCERSRPNLCMEHYSADPICSSMCSSATCSPRSSSNTSKMDACWHTTSQHHEIERKTVTSPRKIAQPDACNEVAKIYSSSTKVAPASPHLAGQPAMTNTRTVSSAGSSFCSDSLKSDRVDLFCGRFVAPNTKSIGPVVELLFIIRLG